MKNIVTTKRHTLEIVKKPIKLKVFQGDLKALFGVYSTWLGICQSFEKLLPIAVKNFEKLGLMSSVTNIYWNYKD